MVSRGFEDGAIGEAPWASVFDPDANLRAVGEIQARGFRAASEVVDRFVRLAGTTGGANAGHEQQRRLVGEVLVQELLRHASCKITLDIYAQAVNADKRRAQARVVEYYM